MSLGVASFAVASPLVAFSSSSFAVSHRLLRFPRFFSELAVVVVFVFLFLLLSFASSSVVVVFFAGVTSSFLLFSSSSFSFSSIGGEYADDESFLSSSSTGFPHRLPRAMKTEGDDFAMMMMMTMTYQSPQLF